MKTSASQRGAECQQGSREHGFGFSEEDGPHSPSMAGRSWDLMGQGAAGTGDALTG